MMKSRVPLTLLALLVMAGIGLSGEVLNASAQVSPVVPGLSGTIGDVTSGDTEGAWGNYDYFTANLDPALAKYLSLVTHRHAGERVWAAYRAGRYPEAIADCKYALERFPNHPRALHLIGEIAKLTNQPTVTIPYYEYALRLYPQYAFTHAQYGNYLIDIGAVTAGVGQLREALRLDPNQFQARAWLSEALTEHPELATDSGVPVSGGNPTAPRSTEPKRK